MRCAVPRRPAWSMNAPTAPPILKQVLRVQRLSSSLSRTPGCQGDRVRPTRMVRGNHRRRGNYMDAVNHQVRLAARPVGLPKPSDWFHAEEPVPEPGEGEVLVKILYVSLDPAMRGWMNDVRSYIAPVGIGEVDARARAPAGGRVQPSRARRRRLRHRHARRAGVRDRARRRRAGKVDTALAPLPSISARSACRA